MRLEAPASRWFGVRVEYELQSRSRRLANVGKQFLMGFVTFGATWLEYDPGRFCDIEVYRRVDGFPVIHFSYESLQSAEMHVASLVARLGEMTLEDFCRDLDLPVSLASGPGEEVAGPVTAEWVGIASEHRRRYWPTVPPSEPASEDAAERA